MTASSTRSLPPRGDKLRAWDLELALLFVYDKDLLSTDVLAVLSRLQFLSKALLKSVHVPEL